MEILRDSRYNVAYHSSIIKQMMVWYNTTLLEGIVKTNKRIEVKYVPCIHTCENLGK